MEGGSPELSEKAESRGRLLCLSRCLQPAHSSSGWRPEGKSSDCCSQSGGALVSHRHRKYTEGQGCTCMHGGAAESWEGKYALLPHPDGRTLAAHLCHFRCSVQNHREGQRCREHRNETVEASSCGHTTLLLDFQNEIPVEFERKAFLGERNGLSLFKGHLFSVHQLSAKEIPTYSLSRRACVPTVC